MKEAQRRVGKKRARASAEKVIKATALRLLQKRWRSVYPRLEKLKAVQKGDGDPEWDDAGEWSAWENEFEDEMTAAFADAAAGMIGTETKYWTDKGKGVVFDTDQFIRDFKDRIGVRSPEHSIKNIGAATLQMTQDKIEAWYANPDAKWQDLVGSLSSLYNESRAQAIAITETTAISAEVMRNTMKQVGVSRWDSIPLYEHTCEDCIEKADANPHELGEEEPPYHVNCNCEMSFTEDTLDE